VAYVKTEPSRQFWTLSQCERLSFHRDTSDLNCGERTAWAHDPRRSTAARTTNKGPELESCTVHPALSAGDLLKTQTNGDKSCC
jgi:hypothetical protein